MKDPANCPECDKEFDAFDCYGYKSPCPHCGELLDIFPTPDIWLDTILGEVGISSINGLASGVIKNIK